LLEKLGDCVDVYKIDYGKDVLSFTTWDAFAIWEKFASFVIDVFFELCGGRRTSVKGEKDYPRALGVL
jgi:hypothetical protein